MPAAGLLKKTWPLSDPPPLTGVNPSACSAAMASDTVIPYRFEGIVTGWGPWEMTMFTVVPPRAEPVGAQAITSPFGTDELYWLGAVGDAGRRPGAWSWRRHRSDPLSEGMVSVGGPDETVTRDRRPVGGAALWGSSR